MLLCLSPSSQRDFAPDGDGLVGNELGLTQTLVWSDEPSTWSFAPRHCLHEDLFIGFVVFQLHTDNVF